MPVLGKAVFSNGAARDAESPILGTTMFSDVAVVVCIVADLSKVNALEYDVVALAKLA